MCAGGADDLVRSGSMLEGAGADLAIVEGGGLAAEELRQVEVVSHVGNELLRHESVRLEKEVCRQNPCVLRSCGDRQDVDSVFLR